MHETLGRAYSAADADIDAIAEFIARDSLSAALRFYDAVDRSVRELGDHPRRYPRYELSHPRLRGLRKRAIDDFENYLAFFKIESASVLILRVLHGARDVPAVLLRDLR